MVGAGHVSQKPWNTLDDVIEAVSADMPMLEGMIEAAPLAKAGLSGATVGRGTRRFSGRTATGAHRDLHEPKPPHDPDSILTFSMEGYPAPPSPAVLNHYWAPGWNSVQALNRFQEEVGGPLRGGEPGARLIEATTGPAPEYNAAVPGPFRAGAGEALVVPAHHLFGSEELSAMAPAVAQLVPAVYVGLSAGDAAARGVTAGDVVVLRLGRGEHHLKVRIVPGLPRDVACLPVGFAGLQGIDLPALGRWVVEEPRGNRESEGGTR
jgi:NADH-quinone oxidoreductase subunit G